jgi:hypothetical protein
MLNKTDHDDDENFYARLVSQVRRLFILIGALTSIIAEFGDQSKSRSLSIIK